MGDGWRGTIGGGLHGVDGEVGGNSCVTWTVPTACQTHVTGTGSMRVTKSQPMPMPAQTHSLNP